MASKAGSLLSLKRYLALFPAFLLLIEARQRPQLAFSLIKRRTMRTNPAKLSQNNLYHQPTHLSDNGGDADMESQTLHNDSEDSDYFCVDYRGANEFIDAHYSPLWNSEAGNSYFVSTSEGVGEERVRNARLGIVSNNNFSSMIPQAPNYQPATLWENGFTLVNSPTLVDDFTNLDQIQSIYLPGLRSILQNEFQISTASHHIMFWNPVMRGQALQSQDRVIVTDPNTNENRLAAVAMSTTAGMAHIDTDVGAHEAPESFLSIMYKNRVLPSRPATSKLDEEDVEFYNPLALAELIDEIEHGKRFFIVNFWRNADRQNPVIQQAPLGLYLPCYDSFDSTNNRQQCFPNARPNPQKSSWYYYPKMTFDECLVFKQYDRDAQYISDIWHSALRQAQPKDQSLSPRTSFDIRALVVHKTEIVPPDQDRYSLDRIRPTMNFEESGEFCKKQDAQQIAREEKLETR